MFRKLASKTIYYVYSNESQFKYHISILGGKGSEAMLILGGGVKNLGKPAYIILARSLTSFL